MQLHLSTTLLVAEGVCLAIAGAAAITDWRTGRIPNWLTLPPLAVAPLAWGLVAGWKGVLLVSLLGAAAAALVPYLMFRRDAAGGGDVKLFAALGAVGGLSLGLEAEVFCFVAAALFSLGRLAWGGKLFRTLWNAVSILVNPILPRRWRREVKPELMTPVRMGAFALAGVLVAVGLRHPTWLWQ